MINVLIGGFAKKGTSVLYVCFLLTLIVLCLSHTMLTSGAHTFGLFCAVPILPTICSSILLYCSGFLRDFGGRSGYFSGVLGCYRQVYMSSLQAFEVCLIHHILSYILEPCCATETHLFFIFPISPSFVLTSVFGCYHHV